jgi:hypothetical protein
MFQGLAGTAMRIWTVHPKYLDTRGLVALWREALLAQAVLRGETKGYRHHPQLSRFQESANPLGAIAQYLREVHAESAARSYRFDISRIGEDHCDQPIGATRGQLAYEWEHLMAKLRERDHDRWTRFASVRRPQAHPLFNLLPGAVAPWEKR